MPIIANGSVVHYRKVGKGVVIKHSCPLPLCGSANMHEYEVKFSTGKYRNTIRLVWLSHNNINQPER